MDRLGPFEKRPRIAVALSGGADSMAALLLTDVWARIRGGACIGLVVDHGLRPDSASEAAGVVRVAASRGIEARVLTVRDLNNGPGLAERAREARHLALQTACAEVGLLHLVFGHHARDQAETVAMRMFAGSTATGLSGMAGLVETDQVRKLRPLLGMRPERLRALLEALGVAWVEDPSNTDLRAQRVRLRLLRAQSAFSGAATAALSLSSGLRGAERAHQDRKWQDELARKATISPFGFALLVPGPIAPEALGHLIATIGGAGRPPSLSQLAKLAAAPRPATLSGVRLTAAGRLGSGLLLLREAASMQVDQDAAPGVLWDRRFRLRSLPDGMAGQSVSIGAWGWQARAHRNDLPAAILRTLPVLRSGDAVVVTPWELFRGPRPHIVNEPPLRIEHRLGIRWGMRFCAAADQMDSQEPKIEWPDRPGNEMSNFGRNLALWVIIALLLVVLFNLFQPGASRPVAAQVAYSDFVSEVNGGRVRDVTIMGRTVTGQLTDGRSFQTYTPEDPSLVSRLTDKGVRVVAKPEDSDLRRWAGFQGPYPLVMGILNVTPDSFSDGGRHQDPVAAAFAMIEAGADLIDVGGESTRPGAEPVSIETELSRVVPVILALAARGVRLSIDTRNAATMQAALAAGAEIVNDVSGLSHDPNSRAVVARAGCPVVLMHMRGTPATMTGLSQYDDVARDVAVELGVLVAAAEANGIARDRIAVDPGIGFAKSQRVSIALLQQLESILQLGLPMLIGVSRKGFIGALSGEPNAADRVGGSIAAALWAASNGASILRVHDVPQTVQAVRVWRGLSGLG
eukprot:gene18581-18866_t